MRAVVIVVAAAAWLLGGCASFERRIEDGLKQAQELSERCERLDRESPVSFDALLGRLEGRFHLNCAAGTEGCPFGVGQQVDELEADLRRTAGSTATVTPKFTALRTSLDAFDASTREFARQARATGPADDVRVAWKAVETQCSINGNTVDCNRSLAVAVQVLERRLAQVQQSGSNMRMAYVDVAAAWDDVRVLVGEVGGQLPTTRQRLTLEIANVVEATRNSLEAIARASAPEFRQVFFDRLLPTYSAERMLDFLERQFEPLDRLVERADDRVYMLGSIAVEWNRPDLQQALNGFYVKHVRKEFRSTSSARAFARAACVRLSKPSPAGRAGSMIMPFLYHTMTLVEEEVRKQEVSERPSLVTGVQVRTVAEGPQVYARCMAAERRILQQLGAAGQRADAASVRAGSQTACAEALIGVEQRTLPQAGTEGVAQLTQDEGAKQVPARIAAEADRLPASALVERKPAEGTVGSAAATPPPARPARPSLFCPRVVPALPGASCVEDDRGAWIEFNQPFASGQAGAPRLVPALRMLGRLVQAQGRVARMEVHGLASAAPMSCRQWRAATRAGDPCGFLELQGECADRPSPAANASSANQLLARGRACWAADVIRANAPLLDATRIRVEGRTSPTGGNPEFDRMVSIRLEWQPANPGTTVGAMQ